VRPASGCRIAVRDGVRWPHPKWTSMLLLLRRAGQLEAQLDATKACSLFQLKYAKLALLLVYRHVYAYKLNFFVKNIDVHPCTYTTSALANTYNWPFYVSYIMQIRLKYLIL
jgi:hypothetical protein